MRLVIPAVLILVCALPASAADPAGVIRVTATYPGADARTVDETILSPLFVQIIGVEGVSRIESEARNDGTGTVTVYFEPKTDLNLAQVVVQNRVSLALPVIPAPCRELGIAVRKLPAGPPGFWLALTSADKEHDEAFLRNYAKVFLKNDLARIPGLADVRVVGIGGYAMRVWLNPDRLRAYRLGPGDVIDALRQQNVRVGAGGAVGGRDLRRTVTASGRLTKPEEFGNVILRANPDGQILRVKDVARVELGRVGLGSEGSGFARINGKPAALIAITAWPGRVTADQLLKIEGAEDLPPGMRFDVVANRTADRLVEVELRLPPNSSLEYTEKKVAQATELIHGLPGKPDTMALTEGHAPNAATILIKVPAKGRPTAAEVDKAFASMTNVAIRVGSAPPGGEAFPVRLALTRRAWEQDEEELRKVMEHVLAGMNKDPDVAALGFFPGQAELHHTVDVHRDKCAQSQVVLNDLFTTLQVTLGGVQATEVNLFGQSWPVIVQADPQFARQIDDLDNLFVRSDRGEMVPLASLIKFRKTLAPPAVVRVNGQRAVIVTAAPAAGKTPAEAAALCVKLAQEVLPRGYHVKDLTGPPR